VLGGVLLAPGLIVLAVDGQPGRAAPGAVLMCGLAAAAWPVALLWRGGNSVAGALDIAADPGVLSTAWAAQTAAWLFAEIAPLAVKLVLDARAGAAAAVLRAARRKIEQEWDLPTRNPPAEQPPAG
jgi:hypothetical protein